MRAARAAAPNARSLRHPRRLPGGGGGLVRLPGRSGGRPEARRLPRLARARPRAGRPERVRGHARRDRASSAAADPEVVACYAIDEAAHVRAGRVGARHPDRVPAHARVRPPHLAAGAPTAPWDALDWGAKYWSSAVRVCTQVRRGVLFPGNQGAHYWDDPGEGFADGYAHLHYPHMPWYYNELMRPDATGRWRRSERDVLHPWTGRARAPSTVGSGRATARAPSTSACGSTATYRSSLAAPRGIGLRRPGGDPGLRRRQAAARRRRVRRRVVPPPPRRPREADRPPPRRQRAVRAARQLAGLTPSRTTPRPCPPWRKTVTHELALDLARCACSAGRCRTARGTCPGGCRAENSRLRACTFLQSALDGPMRRLRAGPARLPARTRARRACRPPKNPRALIVSSRCGGAALRAAGRPSVAVTSRLTWPVRAGFVGRSRRRCAAAGPGRSPAGSARGEQLPRSGRRGSARRAGLPSRVNATGPFGVKPSAEQAHVTARDSRARPGPRSACRLRRRRRGSREARDGERQRRRRSDFFRAAPPAAWWPGPRLARLRCPAMDGYIPATTSR